MREQYRSRLSVAINAITLNHEGVEMPKGKQIIELRIYADGVVTRVHDRTCRKIAEATELPEPHGRLIDADTLKRKAQKVATEAWKMRLKSSVETILNQFIDWIEGAPTVIERSK